MQAHRTLEVGPLPGSLPFRRLRRARAVLRLHRRTLVAALLVAGIVLMVLHWR